MGRPVAFFGMAKESHQNQSAGRATRLRNPTESDHALPYDDDKPLQLPWGEAGQAAAQVGGNKLPPV